MIKLNRKTINSAALIILGASISIEPSFRYIESAQATELIQNLSFESAFLAKTALFSILPLNMLCNIAGVFAIKKGVANHLAKRAAKKSTDSVGANPKS